MTLYLSSSEDITFEIPRKILRFRKEIFDGRNTLIVEIDNPVIGQQYGLGGKDISTLYLVNRFDEQAFDKLNSFPIYVYVSIPKSPSIIDPTSLHDLQNIAWASLYNNEKDAWQHKI